MIVELLRTYNLVVAALIIVAGTCQWRRWRTFPPQERLHWQATALLNLAALIGAVEALARGTRPGIAVWIVAVALTWLLCAVLYWPVTTLMHNRKKETP